MMLRHRAMQPEDARECVGAGCWVMFESIRRTWRECRMKTDATDVCGRPGVAGMSLWRSDGAAIRYGPTNG